MDIDTDLCTSTPPVCGCVQMDSSTSPTMWSAVNICGVVLIAPTLCRDGAINYVATRKQLSIPMMGAPILRPLPPDV